MNVFDLKAKDIFKKYSGTASKRFGQNYIFSSLVNQKIVSFAGNLEGKRILEIGPGPGGLTVEILKQNPAKLVLIEIDKMWGEAWKEISEQVETNVEVIQNDALKVDLTSLDCDILISNLPYNVSSQILFRILPDLHKFERLVLMFQKELADRICADKGTKSYGKLSIISQWKSDIKKGLTLSPGVFTPPPSVYSSVLLFEPKTKDDIDFKKFNKLLTAAFANRRKFVLKQIENVFPKETLRKIFAELNIKETARAEEISIEQFTKIANFL